MKVILMVTRHSTTLLSRTMTFVPLTQAPSMPLMVSGCFRDPVADRGFEAFGRAGNDLDSFCDSHGCSPWHSHATLFVTYVNKVEAYGCFRTPAGDVARADVTATPLRRISTISQAGAQGDITAIDHSQSVTGAAAGMAILYFLREVLIPLVVAFVLAILVNAVVRLIADRGTGAPRWAVLCSPRWS